VVRVVVMCGGAFLAERPVTHECSHGRNNKYF
jgi:hypothetical protein